MAARALVVCGCQNRTNDNWK